jgi:hypothetical protein
MPALTVLGDVCPPRRTTQVGQGGPSFKNRAYRRDARKKEVLFSRKEPKDFCVCAAPTFPAMAGKPPPAQE